MPAPLAFDGVLYFPITPFDAAGEVDLGLLGTHLESRLEHRPGGVFPACGTGELHAMSPSEAARVVGRTVEVVDGAVPVIGGAGGGVATAKELAAAAEEAGADAILLMPPYLVSGPAAGLQAYVEDVLSATSLPAIVYHRNNARYTTATMRHLARNPQVVGFKDGVGDVAAAQDIVLAVHEEGRDDFAFFNGLLTAELTQAAYRGIGIPLYSSAVFAMLPELATLFYRAYTEHDEPLRERLLREFYRPLVALRDETPGFAVSLIKTGVRLGGLPVGSVRSPFVDPTPEQTDRLEALLATGADLVAEHATLATGR